MELADGFFYDVAFFIPISLALYRMFSSVGFGRRSKDQTSNAGRGPV
jgi:hypothetical protein